jgi:hypothetical protein
MVEESITKWWLDTWILGYSLTWKNLSWHQWWTLYHLKPELFFTSWIPLARVHFWKADSGCLWFDYLKSKLFYPSFESLLIIVV